MRQGFTADSQDQKKIRIRLKGPLFSRFRYGTDAYVKTLIIRVRRAADAKRFPYCWRNNA
ncbi:hypothetical protein BN2476_750042 [Paraburkholderia piptadeniae]|uniref:Uncharacterized protein n=1 Tax=Paraburkholderia piptadeniae TaxID=1701573 RepID=A0A1N7SRM4_9BURK|nr:hypothetical protein BN2476_750042 [Paraburkholderia piptadeniae]